MTVELLVLFDIDGTLVHTDGAGKAAIEAALVAVYGTAGPIHELRFDGLTDGTIVRSLLGAAGVAETTVDARLTALWSRYEHELARQLEERRARVRMLAGVATLLDRLERLGAVTGLVTGNIRSGAWAKLRACGLADRFTFGAFGSDSDDRDRLPRIAVGRAGAATGKHFDPQWTWVVGDTPLDVRCARACGVRSLAVASGRYSVRDLSRCDADHVAESLADTADLVRLMQSTPAPGGRSRAMHREARS